MFLIINNDDLSCINQCLERDLDELGQSYKIMNSDGTIGLNELKSYQGVILSGGPWDLTQPMLFSKFKLDIQVMLNADVPVYGICMGHQIMAEANGAGIGSWPKLYHGPRDVEILDHSDLFEGIPDKIKVMEWHQEFVLEPPPGFEITATSADYSPLPSISIDDERPPDDCCKSLLKGCKVQALQNKEKKMYSTQFHPELSGNIGLKILGNFVKLCS